MDISIKTKRSHGREEAETYTARVPPHRYRSIRLHLRDLRARQRRANRIQRRPATARTHRILARRPFIIRTIYHPPFTQSIRKPRVEIIRSAALQRVRRRAVGVGGVVDDLITEELGEVCVWGHDNGSDGGGGVAKGRCGAEEELVGVRVGDVGEGVGHDAVGEDGAGFGGLPVAGGGVEGVLAWEHDRWGGRAGDGEGEGEEGEEVGEWCHGGGCGVFTRVLPKRKKFTDTRSSKSERFVEKEDKRKSKSNTRRKNRQQSSTYLSSVSFLVLPAYGYVSHR